jgi:peptidoglycan L-alanyl-D-glutamate endopeptidase CwlK
MFTFGKRSEKELVGVEPDLVRVVRHALEISDIDFGVTDGLRTVTEQSDLVNRGASKTMKSKHLKQLTGYGEAVDLVGYLHGKARYEWPVVFNVAEAMQEAAEDLGIPLKWGGAWAVMNNNELPKQMQKEYIKRKKAKGKKPFLDGPHFELA